MRDGRVPVTRSPKSAGIFDDGLRGCVSLDRLADAEGGPDVALVGLGVAVGVAGWGDALAPAVGAGTAATAVGGGAVGAVFVTAVLDAAMAVLDAPVVAGADAWRARSAKIETAAARPIPAPMNMG